MEPMEPGRGLIPPAAAQMARELWTELDQVQRMLLASRMYLDMPSARQMLVLTAKYCRTWTDVTCPYLVPVLCPGSTASDVVWLEGPSFNVNFAWCGTQFYVASIVLCGVLTLYANSPSGARARAIGLGDSVLLDMPIKASEFISALNSTPLNSPHDMRPTILAGMHALHKFSKIEMIYT